MTQLDLTGWAPIVDRDPRPENTRKQRPTIAERFNTRIIKLEGMEIG